MSKLELAGVLLLVLTSGVAGATVQGTTQPDINPVNAAEETFDATISGSISDIQEGVFSLSIDDISFDFNLTGDDRSMSVSTPAITADTERSVSTTSCMTNLDEDNAPVDVNADSTNSSVTVTFEHERTTPEETTDVSERNTPRSQQVIEDCTEHSWGADYYD